MTYTLPAPVQFHNAQTSNSTFLTIFTIRIKMVQNMCVFAFCHKRKERDLSVIFSLSQGLNIPDDCTPPPMMLPLVPNALRIASVWHRIAFSDITLRKS